MARTTMPECDDIKPLIGAFQDGELPAHTMKEVARHLAACHQCEADQASYSSIGRMLREAVPEPDLSGFSSAVQARLVHIHVPLRGRFERWLGAQRERFGGGSLIAFAMASAAILAVLILSPAALNTIGRGHHHPGQLQHPGQLIAEKSKNVSNDIPNAPSEFAAAMSAEPSTIISKLETSNPDVAVWSEPTHDTTVIWLPDRQR